MTLGLHLRVIHALDDELLSRGVYQTWLLWVMFGEDQAMRQAEILSEQSPMQVASGYQTV